MKEILLTSSALILALLALRRLFRRTLSRRAQYALWGLVLLRLLVPVSLPAAEFSLLTAAQPVTNRVESLYLAPDSVTTWRADGGDLYGAHNPPQAAIGPATPDNTRAFAYRDAMGNPAEGVGTYRQQILLSDLLPPIWYGGMAVMACWLVLSNLLFWWKLRRARKPCPVEGCARRVYLVESGLPSPCLFGLFRPAIYLTPAALQSPDSLRHVLAHEETHARHFDPLWSLLRGVCLTVYWFDPLVWWAALASRADCELACDEGALRRLGEAERVPYGRTLLSLIPVRKTPANPLLSATTMTAGKRQLKDRITRIAENRKNLGVALFAVVSLAALVCAVTFTGAKKADQFRDVDQAVAILAEELENYGGPDGDIMSKLMVYTPENPSEFFDLEDGELLRVYWGSLWMVSSNLSNPMGWLGSLYRAETPDPLGTGPDKVTELLGSDGQYFYALIHPRWAPEMKTGETQGMSLMNQVTDRVREEVLPCLIAAEPPDWESIVTIPLDSLEPYEPQAAEPVPFPYDSCNMLGDLKDPMHVLGDNCLMFFEAGPPASMGGEIYAGVQSPLKSTIPTPFWSFRPGAGGKYSASLFRNLLGHDGFCITYNANDGPRTLTHEYYYLNEEGRPVLLARMEGYPQRMDLDGDGVNELVSNDMYADHFYFRRDGKHYRADLRPLLWTVWPAGTGFRFDGWDPATRSMPFRAQVSSDPSYQYRTLYFDGENLLVYNDQRHFSDHMVEWFDEDSVIKDAARTAVEERFHASRQPGSALYNYDDWRITDIGAGYQQDVGGEPYILKKVSYEFHTPEPQDAQDPWAVPTSEDLWLVFRLLSEGPADAISASDLVYLFYFQHEGRLTLSQEFLQKLLWEMPPSDTLYLGTATLQAESSAVPAADLARAALDRLIEGGIVNMTLLAPQGGGRYDVHPPAGNWSNRTNGFTSNYNWSYAEDPGSMPAESLLLMSPGGDLSLRFWPGSDLVLLNTHQTARQESVWLRAEPKDDPGGHPYETIFNYMRSWYDETELAGLSPTIRIYDRDLSREKIVQLWAERYEGTKLEVSPGSKYACTYVQIEDVSFPDWLDELTEEELDSFYPEYTKGHERFAFSYTTVFVPENDRALNWIMLGDTAPYEDPDAPEGARTYSRCGYMYLTEEGWRCDETGTGW